MDSHWSDYIALAFDFGFGPITLIANIVLIMILVKYTPESTRTYAAIIFVMTASDCVGAVTNLMTAGRVIPLGADLFIIYRGACVLFFKNDRQLQAQACQLGYTIVIESYMLNHIILILSCLYRAFIITQPFKMFQEKWVYVILAVYTVSHYFYFTWCYYVGLVPMSDLDSSLSKYRPDLVGANVTYYGVDQKQPEQLVFYYVSRLAPLFVILVVFFCRWRIDRYLTSFNISDSVRELQKSVGKVFLAQTTGPILLAIVSIFYLLNAELNASKGVAIFENLMAKPLLLMYIVNPITTIYFVKPYRDAFLKFLGKESDRVSASGPISGSSVRVI